MDDKGQGNNQKFFQLLKELAELQATNMRLQVAIFTRESKEQVDEKASDMAKTIREAAQDYGRKAEKLAEEYIEGKKGKQNVISKYKECLEQINEEYDERMLDIFEKKQELEEDELTLNNHEYVLKQKKKSIAKSLEYKDHKSREKSLIKEIKNATSQGRLVEATQMIEELSELQHSDPMVKVNSTLEKLKETRDIINEELRDCNAQIKECKRDRFKAIKEATSDKNMELQNVNKVSVAKRLLGGILNRINGFNRFKNIVIKSLENKVDKIAQDVLPVIKEEVKKRREETEEKSKEVKSEIAERLSSVKETVSEKAKSVVDRGRTSFNNIIQRGRERKEKIIEAMQDRIEVKKDRVAELQEQYEGKEETYHGAHFKKEEHDIEEEQL